MVTFEILVFSYSSKAATELQPDIVVENILKREWDVKSIKQ